MPFNAVHAPYQPPKDGIDVFPNLKGERQKYAAMLTSTDDAIGAIVSAVEQAGVRDNTLFIFSSDNGGPAPGQITDNGKYRGGKGELYEGGVRVAACVAWDGHIPARSTIDEPLHIVDWRPTLQKLCAAPQVDELPLDGLDIWPTLAAGAKSPHGFILLNTTPRAGAVRSGGWKLIAEQNEARSKGAQRRRRDKYGKETLQLFDLRNDPYEKTNLAQQKPEQAMELQKALAKFAKLAVPPKAGPEPKSFQAPKVWGEFGG